MNYSADTVCLFRDDSTQRNALALTIEITMKDVHQDTKTTAQHTQTGLVKRKKNKANKATQINTQLVNYL